MIDLRKPKKKVNAMCKGIINSKASKTIAMKDGAKYRGLHASYLNGKQISKGLPFIKIQDKFGNVLKMGK